MDSDGYQARHICLVVDSLDEAVDGYSKYVGVQFRPIAEVRVTMRNSSEELEQTFRTTFSLDDKLELVEATETGLFGRDRGLGIHHFGAITTRAQEAGEQQRADGMALEWEASLEGETFARFYARPGTSFPRLEIVDAAQPVTDWDELVAAGKNLPDDRARAGETS
jgi:hypothetical protein